MSNKYNAYYPNKAPITIENANSSYHAQQAAARVWGIKVKNHHRISVFLVEKDGEAVTHSILDL